MARVGMRNSGLSILTNFELKPPDLSVTTTLPAMERSRSNHECHIPPPYVSTPTWRYPDCERFEMGRTCESLFQDWYKATACQKFYLEVRTIYVGSNDAESSSTLPLLGKSKRNKRRLVSVRRCLESRIREGEDPHLVK